MSSQLSLSTNVKLWLLRCLLQLFTVLPECRSANATAVIYAALQGYSLPGPLANYTVVVAPSDAVCAMQCTFSNQRGAVCSASQYDAASGKCYLAVNCAFINPKTSSSKITYVMKTYIDAGPRPNLGFMLGKQCATSFDANFGTDSISGPLTLAGDVGTVSTNYAAFPTALLFPTVSTSYPITTYASAYDASPSWAFHIFGSSFTVSFFTNPKVPIGNDIPLIEFITSSNQMCATFRMGSSGNEIDYYHTSACTCATISPTLAVWFTSSTGWRHVTMTYDSENTLAAWYINSNLYSTTRTSFANFHDNVTRLLLGASVCNRYRTFLNSFAGTISCLQIFRRSLDATQVRQAYNRCLQQNNVFIN